MSFPNPQTTAGQLFEQLNALLESGETPAEFSMRRLEREAQKLMKANAAEGYTAVAAIATLQWDLKAAEEAIANVVALEGRSAPMLANCVTFFNWLCVPWLGLNLARKAIALAPTDRNVIMTASNCLVASGFVSEAADYHRRIFERGQVLPSGVDAVKTEAALLAAGVSEEHLRAELRIAYELLGAARHRVRTVAVNSTPDPDAPLTILYLLGIHGDLETEFQMNAALVERLAALEAWDPNKLCLQCEKVELHAVHAE